MAIARVRLEFNDSAVNRMGMDEAQRQVVEVTRAIYNRANLLTPVRTGRLRSANQFRTYTAGLTYRGEVFNNTDYAAAVHNGAKPRRIVPRRAQALRFRAGGRVLFRASVMWPGTKPRPWLATAMIQVAPRHGFVIDNAGPA
jgi:hypothetical protein